MKRQEQLWQNVCKTVLLGALFLFWAQAAARAQNPWKVTSLADNNAAGTLRAILNDPRLANGDTISFDSTVGSGTITLVLGQLPDINKTLTITGPGATNMSIVNPSGRVFHIVGAQIWVTIQELRLSGQLVGAPGADGQDAQHPNGADGGLPVEGGAILDECSGTLVLLDCIMDGCRAVGGKGGNAYVPQTEGVAVQGTGGNGGVASGGAIAQLQGDLIVSNCTFFSNYAIGGNGGKGHDGGAGGAGGEADGGAIQCQYADAHFFFINSTVYANQAMGGLGGQGGDGWSAGSGPANNGGNGGGGGNALGGGVYLLQGCENIGCTHGIDSCTIYENICYVGTGGAGGVGDTVNGGSNGIKGADGTAYGCGLYYTGTGYLKIGNTIIAGDYATSGALVHGVDVYNVMGVGKHAILSQGWNFIGISDESSGWIAPPDMLGFALPAGTPLDPHLGRLLYNGGPTPTLAPLPCSPVIDAGKDIWGNKIDQAYQPRPAKPKGISNGGDWSDIGAFELQSFPPRPALAFSQPLAGFITIGWTTNYGTCYDLQTNSILAPVGWGNWTGAVGVASGQYQVTVPWPPPANLFYRLLLQ